MQKNTTVFLQDLGKIAYQKAWDYQESLFQEIWKCKKENRNTPITPSSTPNYLLFCEHPHVYTLGKSGSLTHLLLDEKTLAEKGIEFFAINRGGDITYHGDGQIVGYPILDLDNFFNDLHIYLRLLEDVIIHVLADFGIIAGRLEGLTGVWITDAQHPRKICAMGVRSNQWITMHGFALNVNAHLEYFDYIIPCGITDKAVTSMQKELGKELSMEGVKNRIIYHFERIFGAKLITQKQ